MQKIQKGQKFEYISKYGGPPVYGEVKYANDCFIYEDIHGYPKEAPYIVSTNGVCYSLSQIKLLSMEVPTAEELMQSKNGDDYTHWEEIHDTMIEFAKLHVKAALEKAAKYADLHSKYKPKIGELPDINCNKYIYQNSILNAYPLENIK